MQTKFLTLVVLALVCFGSALRVVDQNKGKTLACCGASNSYDTTTQICCINTVFSIPTASSNLQSVCCGTRLLTTTQQCCNAVSGEVSTNDRAIDATATCCGTNALTDSATQTCCSGTVVSNPNGLTECCGSRLFDDTKDLCCGTTLISGAAGKTCCGNSAFTSGTQDCCDGKVQSIANGLSCCGSSTYNPTTQTCCAGRANTGVSLSCCGTKAYDSSTQICCSEEDSAVFSSANGQQCCGPSKTYNPSTQTCCSIDTDNYVKTGTDSEGCAINTNEPKTTYNVGSVANGQCCNGIAYDSATSECCIDKIISNPNSKTCCGRNLYDPANDVCCPDETSPDAKIFTGKASAGLQCCNTATYDPTTSSCPCGVVVSLSNDLTQTNTNPNVSPACCGATQFDGNHKLCCSSGFGNYLFNLDPAADLQCCPQDGKTIYNSGYQVCCSKPKCAGKPSTSSSSGSSTPSPASNSPSQAKDLVQCGDSCCNGVGYFSKYQKCCDDEVVDFNNDAGSALTNPLACCGNTVYNQIYESCCEETVNGKTSTAVFGGPGNWQLCCHN